MRSFVFFTRTFFFFFPFPILYQELVTDKDGYALNPLVMTKFWLHEGFSDAGTYELLLQSRCIITTSMCVAFSFSSHYGTA